MADYGFIVETGVVVPDTADQLAEVQAEFRTAFGDDLDVSPETPQGVLIAAETESRDSVARNNAALANQINPNLAGGVFLDAIWALTGGARFVATPSVLRDVELNGVPGAIIPIGALAAVGTEGPRFALTSAVVLDATGSGAGVFQSVDLGAISVSTGALNTIITNVLGWETVNNLYPAEEGAPEETDAAARRRRRATLALQSVALPEAIVSGVNDLEGVRSMAFRENVSNAPVTIEGVTLAAHSVYACIDGGADDEIALMLLRKKSMGAAWNGSTVVTVQDPFSGQDYEVKFARPAEVSIYMRVTVRAGAPFADVPGTVRAAILAYANGEQTDEDGFIVGGDVSAFEIASAVNRIAAPIFITNLEMSLDNVTFSTATIPITIAQVARTLAGYIAVTVA
jgi:uncharacterized phage protein gp47/JayE